jgi:hypothetical protein
VQSSPDRGAPRAPVVDGSSEASPASGALPKGSATLSPGTAIRVTLAHGIDSGRLKNGDTVAAKLRSSVRDSSGKTLPAGTAVHISVISTVPAGELSAAGEFSLEVVGVGPAHVFTDIKTYRGKPGKRDVADSAPAVGTDAALPAGAVLTFVVQRPPSALTRTSASGHPPGSVNGTASGAPPPAKASNSGEPVYGGVAAKKKGQTAVRSVAPANNTFAPAQHTGQATSAPNQIAPATNGGTATQGGTTQPR